MHTFMRTTLTLAILALFAWTPTVIKAEPEAGDWKGGWNTWAEAAVGDWVEYEVVAGITVKYEVTGVANDKVTYTRTTFMNGEQTGQKEYTRAWKKIPAMQKLPYGREDEVEWADETFEINEETIKCRVARWTKAVDERAEDTENVLKTELWYSRAVPCGGIVQATSQGKASYTLKGFEKVGGSQDGNESPLPKFFAKKGNYAIYAVTRSGKKEFVRVEVTEVTKEATKWTATPCDQNGDVKEGAELTEHEYTREAWDERYGEPDDSEAVVRVSGETYDCSKYVLDDGTQEWLTEDGLLVMKVVKTDSGSEAHMLVRVTME